MNIFYIQYAGDLAGDYDRIFNKGGGENYFGQKYTAETMIAQADSGNNVYVFVYQCSDQLCEVRKNLYTAGLQNSKRSWFSELKHQLATHKPDKVILRYPSWRILRLLRKNNIDTLPVFADSFEHIQGLITRLNHFLLSRELCKPSISYIANHQVSASRSLTKLGVKQANILPYDWEHPHSPSDWKASIADDIETKPINIFYAGLIAEEKGVFDLIKAVKKVDNLNREARLKLAGAGDVEQGKSLCQKLGLEKRVKFLGKLSHKDVLQQMNAADVVVVPSRHEYSEGLPMTIMESLLVKTPLILSDHPIFVGRLKEKQYISFFPEKDSQTLAESIVNICATKQGYTEYCDQYDTYWDDLILELKWADAVNYWLKDKKSPTLKKYSLVNIS